MSDDRLGLMHGEQDLDKDFSHSESVLNGIRVAIAMKIMATLAERKLSMLEAQILTGVARTDYSRIRNAHLKRFTIDRLIAILSKLDEEIEFDLSFKTRRGPAPSVPQDD